MTTITSTCTSTDTTTNTIINITTTTGRVVYYNVINKEKHAEYGVKTFSYFYHSPSNLCMY